MFQGLKKKKKMHNIKYFNERLDNTTELTRNAATSHRSFLQKKIYGLFNLFLVHE